MKKTICLFLILSLFACLFCSCGEENRNRKDNLSVIATIFPEYDWVKEVLGNNPADAELTLLLDNGVDLHSYQPTAADMVKVAGCDLFIYVGGESDEWVNDALKEAINPDMIVLDLLDILGSNAVEEETVEGMEPEEEDGEETEYDEHIWLSLKNASLFVSAIKDALCKLDPEHKDTYTANAEQYTEKLNALDARYLETAKNASCKTVLFGDRFPFLYLTKDYGLSYYAAFKGCSAESEASFETVSFLAGKVDELGLQAIFCLEGSDQRIATTILSTAKSKDVALLSVDSMQSTTMQDVKNGVTYLSVMEKNLSALAEGLR